MQILVLIAAFVVTFLFIASIRALLVMVLWNLVMPDLFHLPELGFVSAFLLTLLASTLVGSSGGVESNK